jgi:alpha-beta hydrolase superfamily lysophospholipase
VLWLTSNDSHGNWITGLYAEADSDRNQCLIHFYAGHENLGRMEYFIDACRSRGLSVLIFDYRGYGASDGRPRESSLYSDAELIYDWLADRYPDKEVLVSGRALGSAVAIHLAQHRDVRGLILFSPFTNMMDLVSDIFPHDEVVIEDAMPFIFDNVEMIRKVKCPILMINGAEDGVIPRDMTLSLEAAVKSSLTRVDVPGATHEDLIERNGELVWRAVFDFIDKL